MQQMESAAHLRRRYHDVDLVVSCGDLPAAYLEFITSVLNVPLFYVRGNHDTGYSECPPGGENLHERIVTYRGLTFVGLEGSIRYNDSPIQYTNAEMSLMVLKMAIKSQESWAALQKELAEGEAQIDQLGLGRRPLGHHLQIEIVGHNVVARLHHEAARHRAQRDAAPARIGQATGQHEAQVLLGAHDGDRLLGGVGRHPR